MDKFDSMERLGMGLVFFGAAIVSARNLLRARPKPEIEPKPDAQSGKIGKLPPPSDPGAMGRVMRWGTGDAAARARIAMLTREELMSGGVTKELPSNGVTSTSPKMRGTRAIPAPRGGWT